MNANTYLSSLGIEVTEAAQAALGRLALAGEFLLDGERGVLLHPKRGDVSDRYLEMLSGAGYAFVIADGGGYPAVYAREGEGLAPMRALPIAEPRQFPSQDVLAAWVSLLRTAAGRGEAGHLAVAQLVARLEDDGTFGTSLVRTKGDTPISRLGGDESVAPEPFRTAAALLAGFRMRPQSPKELTRLLVALSSLMSGGGQFSGLPEVLAPLIQAPRLGVRRLLVSGGPGAEATALLGGQGTIVLPRERSFLEPLLARLLPDAELLYTDFLRSHFEQPFDGIVIVPPLGLQLSGPQLAGFQLAKRGGKLRGRVAAEILFVEHALAALSDGGLLVVVLPEGLLSSAGHADFRQWTLEHARLLSVVSLPAGTCFNGSGMKCSVVLLRKPASADDYPILMVNVQADDLSADIASACSKLMEFLEQEVAACA